MAIAWPAALPQKLLMAGASLGYGNGLLEYKPDRGPTITRRVTTAAMRPLTGSVICSSAQIDAFETFFLTTVLSGALPFTCPDPRSGAALLVKFNSDQLPSYQPLGGDNFQLALSLWILP